ncbi:MAG: DUF2975 domain-containing protein [Bacillota bacterium]|jgi:hypothetical protein|nr:DUF2975 domain-containing protein [Bacillota bacterium]
MSLLGKKSAASALEVILKLLWYIGIAALSLIVIVMLIDLIDPGYISQHANFFLTLSSFGIKLKLSSELIEPPRPAAVMALGSIVMLFVLALIYQMRKIFASLTENKPFTLENSRRLRIMGILTLVGSVVYSTIGSAIGSWFFVDLFNRLDIPDLKITIAYQLHLESLFFGVVLLLLSEIFRRGCELQEQVDLTV